MYRRGVVVAIILFTGLNLYWLSFLGFDFEIEQLFPNSDPDLEFYETHIVPFKTQKSYVVLGLESPAGIFNEEFLATLDLLTEELSALPFTKHVSSLSNLSYYRLSPLLVPSERKFIRPAPNRNIPKDSSFLRGYEDAWEKYVATSEKATALYMELEIASEQAEEKQQLLALKEVLDTHVPGTYHLSGSIDARHSVQEELQEELIWLLSLSLIFILVFLFATFQSFKGVFIPLLVLLTAVCWTLGSMAFFSIKFNLMTIMVPSITLIVALSDVIHIMSRYKEEMQVRNLPGQAIRLAIKDIGVAIFLTSVTTSLGFLSLGFANIKPFVEFGLITALGVLYAYVLAVILLPLLLVKNPDVPPSKTSRFSKWALSMYNFSLRHKASILVICMVLFCLALMGMSQLRVDSFLYEEMEADNEYSQSLDFFDQEFSGIRPIEIYLSVKDPDKTLYDLSVLRKIDSLESYLTTSYGASSVYGLHTHVKRLHRVYRQGRATQYKLPKDTAIHRYIEQFMDTSYQSMGLSEILSADYQKGLIQAKIADLGSHEIKQRNERLSAFGQELFPQEEFGFRISGTSLLLDKSNTIISKNLGLGLFVALLIIAALMGLLYRSLIIVLVGLLCNLFPLMLIAGLMGFWGIGLKMSTAMIFCISFGIAVDDSIHFLSRLKFEWKDQVSLKAAIAKTYLSTGKAIIITSCVLILGFGLLLFSSFSSSFFIGLFVSLALLFAVFSDLILLPILLSLAFGEKRLAEKRVSARLFLKLKNSNSH